MGPVLRPCVGTQGDAQRGRPGWTRPVGHAVAPVLKILRLGTRPVRVRDRSALPSITPRLESWETSVVRRWRCSRLDRAPADA
jgi:hypothetical protein